MFIQLDSGSYSGHVITNQFGRICVLREGRFSTEIAYNSLEYSMLCKIQDLQAKVEQLEAKLNENC